MVARFLIRFTDQGNFLDFVQMDFSNACNQIFPHILQTRQTETDYHALRSTTNYKVTHHQSQGNAPRSDPIFLFLELSFKKTIKIEVTYTLRDVHRSFIYKNKNGGSVDIQQQGNDSAKYGVGRKNSVACKIMAVKTMKHQKHITKFKKKKKVLKKIQEGNTMKGKIVELGADAKCMIF